MDISILAYFIYNIMFTLSTERFMNGFFGNRRTKLQILIPSFAAYSVASAAVYIFLGIPALMLLTSLTAIFLLTFNYNSTHLKRIFVTFGIVTIIVAIEGFVGVFIMLYNPGIVEQLDTLNEQFTWSFVAMGAVAYTASLMFSRFTNIRKNTITLPVFFWISSLLVPASSIVMILIVITNMLQIPAAISVVTIFLINAMVFYLHDTLSKVYEERLAAKNRFLARMSHEIRTPISAVMGISEIQLRNKEMPPHTEEAFNKIYDSSKVLLNIVADILDFSKIESEKMPLVNAEYNVANLVNDAAQMNLIYQERKDVSFQLIVDENLPEKLIGDVLRIKQIINNLLTNAFKFTESGSVVLSLQWEKNKTDAIKILVEDTGIGMTAAQLDEIKSLQGEYVRLQKRDNSFVSGIGLGLPIICDLVQMMNAQIDIKSEVGKGTSISIRIPQGLSGTGTIGQELANNLQNFESNSYSIELEFEPEQMPDGNVLVVDDIDTNLYVAEAMLESFGVNIELCESGQEAIDKINDGNIYDIIFMDHMMPGMDGIEATKILRSLGYNHPVVALTANAVKGQADVFMQNGFSGFMAKPIDIKLLNSYLVRFVKNKQEIGDVSA